MRIGNKEFDTKNKIYIMGILNITPDSFSDGGKFNDLDRALAHTEQMIQEGADIIDVGGESTRPGYIKISEEEESARVTEVIRKIKENFDIPVSIDSYKSRVARDAVQAGADLINDVWGGKYDSNMAKVIADTKVACCLMHNRDLKSNPYGEDLMADVLADMKECIALAKNAGVADDKIILDPGIGFGKTLEDNLKVMKHLEDLNTFGYPVLLGTSRKSMIGLTLDTDVAHRLEGTIATSVIGAMKGYSFVRVHDVLENKRAIEMTRAILNA